MLTRDPRPETEVTAEAPRQWEPLRPADLSSMQSWLRERINVWVALGIGIAWFVLLTIGSELEPATDQFLEAAGRAGKSVTVFAPGFAADCLETLEELAIRGREQHQAAGGRAFAYLPCLNDSPQGVDLLEALKASVEATKSKESKESKEAKRAKAG